MACSEAKILVAAKLFTGRNDFRITPSVTSESPERQQIDHAIFCFVSACADCLDTTSLPAPISFCAFNQSGQLWCWSKAKAQRDVPDESELHSHASFSDRVWIVSLPKHHGRMEKI